MDCRRTDRSQPLFKVMPPEAGNGENIDDEKEASKRFSMISPNMSDIGSQAPSNDHIERLAGILLTYNFYEKELGQFLERFVTSHYSHVVIGYVQGMSDLCAPIYVVMDGDEEMTFWCFVEVMNRMVCLTCICYLEREISFSL